LEEISLTLDEFEALRLADHEGLYQEKAAQQMNVSRPTFGRILESAHRKIAEVLVHAKSLAIDGGPVDSIGLSGGKRSRGWNRCHVRKSRWIADNCTEQTRLEEASE
jgi:predicted DNA-binding protein (UPF0251 family)